MKDINLLPESMRKNYKSKNKFQMYSIVILLLIIVGSYGSLYIIDYMNRQERVVVNQKIQAFEEVQEDKSIVDNFKKEIAFKEQVIEEIDLGNTNYYLLMQNIRELVPQGITFIEQNSENGKMTIRGVAKKDQEIAEFVSNLQNIMGAKDVWIESANYTGQIEFLVTFVYDIQGSDANDTK